MKADDPYFKTEIRSILVPDLEMIIRKEIIGLMYDFGQKVTEEDPEFRYIVKKTVETLREYYPAWKMSYLGECFRKGKLDDFDKGQKITMKRLEYWFKAFNSYSSANMVRRESNDGFCTEADSKRFVENGKKYADLLLFRISRKPQYDGDEWTLENIAATEDYKKWKSMGYRNKVNFGDGINKLQYAKA